MNLKDILLENNVHKDFISSTGIWLARENIRQNIRLWND